MKENISVKIFELAWDQKKAINNIKKKKYIGQYILQSHVLILLCTMIYGMVLGSYVKGPTIIFNAIKIPILYIITLYIALPIIFVVDVMFEKNVSFTQLAAILLLGFTSISVVLIAFSPLILFFIISAPDYGFIVILIIVISGFAGFLGIISILSNFKKLHETKTWNPSLIIGSFIIIFVGTQLAWTLRPFFHISDGFTRPISGNFYVALASIVANSPMVSIVLIGIFGLIAALITISRLEISRELVSFTLPETSGNIIKTKIKLNRKLKVQPKHPKMQELPNYP